MQTGGVTLTLSIAYLSAVAHRRNRERQGQALYSQALTLQNLMEPVAVLPAPCRSELAAARRSELVEAAKDRWNEEVINAARWAQDTDWGEVRENLEEGVSTLWNRAVGRPEMSSKPTEAGIETRDRQEKVQAVDAAESSPGGSGGVMASVLEKGKDTAQTMMGMVKSAVGMAKTETRTEGGNEAKLAEAGPVEKALKQRFEKTPAEDKRSVAEVLRERYRPMDKRDNTQLRGL